MGNDIKGDHFKLMKNTYQDMEDFIVQRNPEPGLEVGKGAFGGDIVHVNASVGAICPAFVFIPQIFEKPVHVGVLIDISEQFQQKHRRGIIGWRTLQGISVSGQGPDKGKIDQGDDHPCESTLDIPVGHDFNKLFFESIGRKHH
jgi:hypothetical protein